MHTITIAIDIHILCGTVWWTRINPEQNSSNPDSMESCIPVSCAVWRDRSYKCIIDMWHSVIQHLMMIERDVGYTVGIFQSRVRGSQKSVRYNCISLYTEAYTLARHTCPNETRHWRKLSTYWILWAHLGQTSNTVNHSKSLKKQGCHRLTGSQF